MLIAHLILPRRKSIQMKSSFVTFVRRISKRREAFVITCYYTLVRVACKLNTRCQSNSHFGLLSTDKFDHVCEQCGWKFQSKGNLKGHLASTHATEKPFKCDQCYKRQTFSIFLLPFSLTMNFNIQFSSLTDSFKTKHHLRNHSIMHDDNYKPHECSICGAKFRRKNTLNVHIRSHTMVTPYTCKFCGKSFKHCITLQVETGCCLFS